MNLLLTGAYSYSDDQLKKISELGFDITFIQDERKTIDFDVKNFDAVVCNGLFLYNDINKFENLKFIQTTSAGLDRIPLDYVKNKKIKVINAKGIYSIPMAEWAILKILEIYKDSFGFKNSQSKNEWNKSRNLLELNEKEVAIFGVGDVGTEIARRLKAFGAKTIGINRGIKTNEFIDKFYTIYEKEKALKTCDVAIIALPLSEETKGLFNKNVLKIMKDDSVIINISRGGIIDESSLISELNNGKFLGVALDVFENEPLDSSSKLWSIDKVNITPHNSFVSDKVKDRMFDLIMKSLMEFKEK